MLYLVRHGRTDANAKGLLQGRLDPPLDEIGIKQAEAIAEEQRRELHQANLELQRLNKKLQKRVKRRTAELSAARDETLQSNRARTCLLYTSPSPRDRG